MYSLFCESLKLCQVLVQSWKENWTTFVAKSYAIICVCCIQKSYVCGNNNQIRGSQYKIILTPVNIVPSIAQYCSACPPNTRQLQQELQFMFKQILYLLIGLDTKYGAEMMNQICCVVWSLVQSCCGGPGVQAAT